MQHADGLPLNVRPQPSRGPLVQPNRLPPPFAPLSLKPQTTCSPLTATEKIKVNRRKQLTFPCIPPTPNPTVTLAVPRSPSSCGSHCPNVTPAQANASVGPRPHSLFPAPGYCSGESPPRCNIIFPPPPDPSHGKMWPFQHQGQGPVHTCPCTRPPFFRFRSSPVTIPITAQQARSPVTHPLAAIPSEQSLGLILVDMLDLSFPPETPSSWLSGPLTF